MNINKSNWLYYSTLRIGSLYVYKTIWPPKEETDIILITKLYSASFEGIIKNGEILKDLLPRYNFYNIE